MPVLGRALGHDALVRFLFTCVALEGHYRPLLPLARALRTAGHEVAFATAASMESRVSADGFDLHPAGISELEFRTRLRPHLADAAKIEPDQRRVVAFTLRFARIQAPPKAEQLAEIVRTWQPDALVHDSADLAAPLVGAAAGIPSFNHAFGSLVPLAALLSAGAALAPLWAASGLEPDPYAGAFRGPYLDICPPALAWEAPLSERIQVRPCTPSTPGPPSWLPGLGRPLVYITLGTIFNEPDLYRPLLDGLAGLDGRAAALVTIGRTGDAAMLEPLPERVRIEQYVSQDQVLPSADLVVSHGGSGTTLGALAHGLPMLLVPQGADQFENAVRCEQAGAAIVLPPGGRTAEAVRDALHRLLDEASFRSSADRVAREIAAMPAPDEAASDVVDWVLANR